MYIERYGTGERIYFGLHGWSGDHTTFAPLRDYLPGEATLYSADLPGYGRSPAPRRWELSAIIDEICACVSSMGLHQVTIIGNCSGGILGVLTAARLSTQIERLVMIDPFAYVPWYFKVFVETSFGKYAYYSTFANPLGRWLTNLSLSRHRQPETSLTASFASVNHEASYQYLVLLSQIGGIDQLPQIQTPMEIGYGARTFGAVKKSIVHWQHRYPQARRWELAGAGHLPLAEATEQLSRMIFGAASDLHSTEEHHLSSTIKE